MPFDRPFEVLAGLRRSPKTALLFSCVAALALSACPRRDSQDAQPQPQGPMYGPQQGYPPQQGYGPYPGYGQPGAPPPGYPPQTPVQPSPQPTSAPGQALPPVGGDPINALDVAWLRNEAGAVMGALIAALPAATQAKVANIPFVADPTIGMVNAFAACDEQGQPLMAISDGLLEIEANIAQFRATDEIFATQKLDAYIQLLAQNQAPGAPIVRPPAGFIDPNQHVDGRKVARQRQLLDEQIAFVLGHELAHHHLGHTGCANGGGSRGVGPGDLSRLLSRAMPMFNQPNEIAADIAGVNNLLDAGAKQQGYRWNEEGAVLTLHFFSALDRLTPASIVFAFENSHPHPLVRLPIVQNTANAWRMTGGTRFSIPGWFAP